jgi:uncharacterized membrane protein
MKLKISHPFWQVLGIGVLAGMRSSSAPVITSHILSHHHSNQLEKSPLNFMQSEKFSKALNVMAISELVIDKLPSTPNRILPPVVAVRCLSGALAGASIYKASGGNAVTEAVIARLPRLLQHSAAFICEKPRLKKQSYLTLLLALLKTHWL